MMLIIIPARGGSKGLSRKNLADVAGVPLVGRAVLTARRAITQLNESGRVVCSTDSEEIRAVAIEWGAEVPFVRPASLATDDASSIDVVRHSLAELEAQDDTIVVLLQATSPLTEPEDVIGAVRQHREGHKSIVSVTSFGHPLEWVFDRGNNGSLRPAFGCELPHQRQRTIDRLRPNGAVYVATAGHLMAGRGFAEPDCGFYEMPPERSIDVDSMADLAMARGLLAAREVGIAAIGERLVGSNNPCFIIAEAGVNHNGELATAKRLVDKATQAGADAVKFQTFRPEEVVSPAAPQADYQKVNTGRVEPQLDMIRRLALGPDDTERLAEHCLQQGILFLSSPFDYASANLLDSLGVPAFKVGSGELTNHPFLAHLAASGRPLLVSTGMSSMAEVALALQVIEESGDDPQVILLHCVSAYPAPLRDCNLAAIGTLRDAFRIPVGWSDHTLGMEASVAAVALGASLLEKHFTLDRGLPGPDHRASMEPEEFADLVAKVRDTELLVGDGVKRMMPSERQTATVARRSLHSASDLSVGHRIRERDLIALRPGTGISPARTQEVVGRRIARRISVGSMIGEQDLD